jgi:hypothetical protein
MPKQEIFGMLMAFIATGIGRGDFEAGYPT